MRIKPRQQETYEVLLWEYIDARRAADQALQALNKAEQKLLGFMEHNQRKTYSVSEDGFKFTATYTQRTNTQIDEKGLRKALTAKVFDRYTTRQLDRKALEKAMSDGEIDPTAVAPYVESVPGKKFVTYRMKEDKDES